MWWINRWKQEGVGDAKHQRHVREREAVQSASQRKKNKILLQDTTKIHNMLMDIAKTRIYPKTPKIRVSLPRHTAPIILIISQICGE